MEHQIKNDNLEEIKLELYRTDILYSEFNFECFCEGIITYGLYQDNVYHEILVGNKSNSFFPKQRAIDLLERTDLDYLCHCVYINDSKGGLERIAIKEYAPLLDYSDLKNTGYTLNDGEEIFVGDILLDKDISKTPLVVCDCNTNGYLLVNANLEINLDFYFNEHDKSDYNYDKICNLRDLDKGSILKDVFTIT
jgi:hypothetical protein